jgi:hypothetical protein
MAGVGRAMAQAVSRWPHTTEAPVSARVSPRGICGGQSGTGTGLLRVLRFSLVSITAPGPHIHISSGG